MNENVIEWLRGDEVAGVTAPSGSRLKGRIVKLSQNNPSEVEIVKENPDGSIFAHVPVSYIKVSPPRKISEKQKKAAAERFKKMWREKQGDGFEGEWGEYEDEEEWED